MPEELTDQPELRGVAEALRERFGDAAGAAAFEKGELSVPVGLADLAAAVEFLKTAHGFNALDDMIGLDRHPAAGEGRKRFAVLYQLYRFPGRLRVRLVVDVGEGQAVPSIVSLFKSADWAEREIFDMFGIVFSGHPDLRRVYLPEEFTGHPLRKDFPLEG
jgi:NADH-quinone oxidoreductase subunit C